MTESKQKSIHEASISDNDESGNSHQSSVASSATVDAGGKRLYAMSSSASDASSNSKETSEDSDVRFAAIPSSVQKDSRRTVEEHVRKMAAQAGERMLDWEASFKALVLDVWNFYAHEINEIIDPINEKLTHYLNGLRWDIQQGTEGILQKARHDFGSAHNNAFAYRNLYAQFREKLTQEKKIFPDLEEEDVRKTHAKSMGDWVMFFGLMAILVLIESGANTTLLSSVIEGGIVGAFITATLVSIINVMGFGSGLGFLCAFLRRKAPRNILYIVMSIWLGFAIFLNLGIGRYREKLVLGIEAKEKDAENANIVDSADSLQNLIVPAEELAEVSFNLSVWQFESVLFFIMGVILCCLGFYKGFSFHAPGENLKPMLEKVDNLKQTIDNSIESIPVKSEAALTSLRESVGQRIQQFGNDWLKAQNRMQDMEAKWSLMTTVIAAEFINPYNTAHPRQKITLETLKQVSIPDFPATDADKDTLIKASKFIDNYRETEQEAFYHRIQEVNNKIADLQAEYRAAVRIIISSDSQTNG